MHICCYRGKSSNTAQCEINHEGTLNGRPLYLTGQRYVKETIFIDCGEGEIHFDIPQIAVLLMFQLQASGLQIYLFIF